MKSSKSTVNAGPATSRLHHLSEVEKIKLRQAAFEKERLHKGAIEQCAAELGEHPLVIGGGTLVLSATGMTFEKGDPAKMYATRDIEWDGTASVERTRKLPARASPAVSVPPPSSGNPSPSRGLRNVMHADGYEISLCEPHNCEECDICCVDLSQQNGWSRQQHIKEIADEERGQRRAERGLQGCGNPVCSVGKDGGPPLTLVCDGCKAMVYCSCDCQLAHRPVHQETCDSLRQKCRDASGKSIPSHHAGTKVEQLVNGEPTGFVCTVKSLDVAQNMYTLKVCKYLTTTFTIMAADVGHGAYTDQEGKVHEAIPNQPWRMWHGEIDGRTLACKLMGGISFNPYGRGPYQIRAVFEQFVNERPTGLMATIIDTDPPLVESDDEGVLEVSGGGGLASLTYTMQYCGFYTDTFERSCGVVHATWQPA